MMRSARRVVAADLLVGIAEVGELVGKAQQVRVQALATQDEKITKETKTWEVVRDIVIPETAGQKK